MIVHWRAAAITGLLWGAVMVSGCVATARHLSEADRLAIREVDFQLAIPQETFVVSAAMPARRGQGGLIDDLTRIADQKSAQDRLGGGIAQLIEPYVQLDLRSEAASVLPEGLRVLPMKVHAAVVTPTLESKAKREAALADGPPGRALIRMTMQHELDPLSGTLVTRSYARVWQHGRASESFGGGFVHRSKVGFDAGKDVETMRSEIREAVRETMRMLAAGLMRPADATLPAATYRTPDIGRLGQLRGFSLAGPQGSSYFVFGDVLLPMGKGEEK